MSQACNLPLQTDYKLTLSDRQPSRNSHSSRDWNRRQHGNYIPPFFPFPFFKSIEPAPCNSLIWRSPQIYF